MADLLSKVLGGLRSPKPKKQKKAYDRLWDIELTPQIGIELIEAAAEAFPNDGLVEDAYFINRDILRFLWDDPHPEFSEAVERVYDRLDESNEVRETALRLLAELRTPESLQALVRLLRRPSSRTVDLNFTFVPLIGSDITPREPRDEGVALFPELLECTDHPQSAEILRVIVSYAESGILNLNQHVAFAERLVHRTRQHLSELSSAEERFNSLDANRPEMDQDEFDRLDAILSELSSLFDVVVLWDDPSVDEVLRNALGLDFPRLQVQAAIGLIRRRQSVEPQLLDRLAADAAVRSDLWDGLYMIDRQDAFPPRFYQQQELAEADLVKWLEHPMEMGQAPDDVEFLQLHQYDDPNQGRVASYFFRCRSADFQDGEWFVGMAGPYVVDSQPTMHGERTFSHFHLYDQRDMESHIRSFLNGDE